MRASAEGCGVGITGLGAYLPSKILTNDAFPGALAAKQDFLLDREGPYAARWAHDPFRGAVERRVIAADELSSDMEAHAARAALQTAQLPIEAVELLIGYSQVPDDLTPGNHGRVARLLGLSHQLTAMTVDTGCASFVTQLNTATSLIRNGDHPHALLYQSSATSLIQDPKSRWACGVGDGAVAQVIGQVPSGYGWIGRAHLTRADLCDAVLVTRADRRRDWWSGGHDTAPIHITSRDAAATRKVGEEGVAFAKEACDAVLQKCGYSVADIDFLVCAQPLVWFGEACADAMGLRPDQIVAPAEHFQKYAHLLPASVSLNLWVAWSTGRLQRGDLVLIYSPGAGFTQAATLMRWWMDPPGSG